MSDRKWDQDVWSVLMDDGTEHLDIVINQSDHTKWTFVAQRHKWVGPEFNVIMIHYVCWSALIRRGDLNAKVEFEKDFLTHVADLKKEKKESADPTQTDT